MHRQTPDREAAVDTRVLEELAPARPAEVVGLRRRLLDWLRALPLDVDSVQDILLATYEALANVAAHAYPAGTGWARLRACRAGDAITVTVADTGRGIPAGRAAASARGPGGRGLLLIGKVTDRVDLDTGAQGTRVTMTWRPASLRPG